MTIDDLYRILTACAGESEEAGSAADFQDSDFDDLGYDSLALMETAARIWQEYRVSIPDERLAELRTPRELLDFVNDAAAAA